MATMGITCVVRQGLGKFMRPFSTKLLKGKAQKLSNSNLMLCPCSSYCSTTGQDDITVEYRYGLSVFSVPLPSRKEYCEFVLKPVSNTVKDFIHDLKQEDMGVDRVALNRADGSRVAGSTTIDILLRSEFTLTINEESYDVVPPEAESLVPSEEFQTVSDVKTLTAKLYSQLNVAEFQLKKEHEIIKQLEDYQLQIAPFEKIKAEMEAKINNSNSGLVYVGSTLMGLQFGFFARLTWCEYSWDVMEPVTYFATYLSLILWYAYFAVASQEYNYVEAWDREFARRFYAMARKNGFDIEEYNRLANVIAQCKSDLTRLRDPLQVNLPIREL